MYRWILSIAAWSLFILTAAPAFSKTTVRTEDSTIPASGITTISFRDIRHADIEYRGTPGRDDFALHLEKQADGTDSDEIERILSDIRLETNVSGATLVVRLTNPRQKGSGILDRWLKRKEWRADLKIQGPSRIDADIEAKFSKVSAYGTAGSLSLSTEFTDATVSDHEGSLRVRNSFGYFSGENIRGDFDIDTDFSRVVLAVSRLAGDSRLDVSFGGGEVSLPENAGAVFHSRKSFGEISFDTAGTLTSESANRRTLNGGGPAVSLNAEFGNIQVNDSQPESRKTKQEELPAESRAQAAAFEQGEIQSVTIQGGKLRTEEYLLKKMDIHLGETYTREEIAAAVKKIQDDRYIDYASFTVDPGGRLTVHVYEVRPFDRHFDLTASFTRVSGLGLGPRGRITSAVAPLSEVNGYARYNWGEEDWSWGAGARRDLFGGRLGIGGDYRWDYESGMDWAVPETESNLNELLLGYESKNYYHVESSGGYVVYSLNDRIEARADFFDNRYRSVEKVTNWSLFNRGDTKEPNAPLGADQPGRISGLRYSLDLHDQTSSQNFRSRFEVERSFKNGSGTGPLYTRLFVTAAWNMQYWYGDLVKFRLAGGYSPHTLPDQRSFRLGGLNTLRGYAPMSVPVHPAGETPFTIYDGGDRMFLANLDYFYGRDIALIFFGDLGGVWRKGETVDAAGLRRDIGIGLALGGDFFTAGNESDDNAGFRVNWAMPVGPVPHVSRWTVNFVRAY